MPSVILKIKYLISYFFPSSVSRILILGPDEVPLGELLKLIGIPKDFPASELFTKKIFQLESLELERLAIPRDM